MTTSLDSIEQLVTDLAHETEDGSSLAMRPRGYRCAAKERVPWPPAGAMGPGLQPPRPLPKQPKGRFFIGTLLFTICSVIIWCVWDTFLSVAAFGVVKTDTLRISAPFDGRVAQLHTREGQSIQKGQPLISLESAILRRQLARLQDELHVEQARLQSESVRVHQKSQEYAAEYYALWANLQKHRAELTRMERDLKRIQNLKDQSIISVEEIDRKRFDEAGQRALVEKLTVALKELRKRADVDSAASAQSTELRLRPIRARIDYLKAEIDRVREEIHDGDIVAPVNGTVIRCHAAEGQQVTRSEVIVEIVDSDSVMIELFVPQRKAHHLQPGHAVNIAIEPFEESMTCTVIGSRDCYELAPESIRRYYRSGETLMPVMLKPDHSLANSLLHSGAVVRLKLWEHVARHWDGNIVTEHVRELWQHYFPPKDESTVSKVRSHHWPRFRAMGALLFVPEGEPS